MKYPFLLVLILLSTVFASAQSNYKPGYVVSLNGDTSKGFIDYKGWERNPGNIYFKDGINSNEKTYTVANINAFGVAGLEYYEKKTVPVSTDDIDINKLSTSPQVNYVTKTVFLRVLNKGKLLTLYLYIDDLKKRYYVTDNTSGEIQELGFHMYIVGEHVAVQTVYRFRSQFEYLAQKFGKNTPKLENIILHAGYDDTDLSPIVIAINGNTGKQFATVNLFGIRFYGGAAAVDNVVSFNGTLTFPNNNSVFPKLTGGIDFMPNKVNQKLFFRLELAATGEKHNLYSTANNSGYTGTSISNTLNYSQFTISATPEIIYNIYNTDKLKAFAGAGFSFNNAFYNNYKTITNFSNISTLVQNKYPDFLNTFVSFPLKAGVLLNKKIEVYGAYSFPVQVTQYTDFSTSAKSYQIGFNYLFGGK